MTIGFNPTFLISLRNYPKYRQHLRKFQSAGGVVHRKYMILSDFEDAAGLASGHYFHQDLLVAQFIFKNSPERHVDIGSRIDGFVAHVASFRKVEVFDIRELNSDEHENILFRQADLMDESEIQRESTDSLSCLHALEHVGLGRYGDSVDPSGHVKAFNNLLRMLKKEGVLYVSLPISDKSEVFFNAHRVFQIREVLSWADNCQSLRLERFDLVDDSGKLHKNLDLFKLEPSLKFGLGIYTFRKL